MPLPFDLASLITRYTAPASSRVDPQTLQRMQFEHGKKQDAEQNRLKQAYFDQGQGDRDYNRDQDAWDKFRDAILSGDKEAIQLSKADIERRGFQVDYPDLPAAAGAEVKDPTLGGTLQAEDPEQWVPVAGDDDGNEVSRGTPGSGSATAWIERALGLAPTGAAPSARAAEDQFLSDVEQNPGVPESPAEDLPAEKPSASGEIARSLGLPASEPQANPNRFSVRDRSGKVVLEADMGQIVSARQQRVGEVFDGYIAGAGDEQEKAAAGIAKQVAQKALAAGHTMKEAVALGIQEYNRQVDPYRKAFVNREKYDARADVFGGAGGGGAAAGAGGELSPGQSRLSNEEWDWIIKGGQTQGLNVTSIAKDNLLQEASQAAKSGEGLSQIQAMRSYIARLSGATVTDAEARDYFQSVGLSQDVLRHWNRIFETGQQSPELMRQLQNVLNRAAAESLRKRQRAARAGAEYALSFGAGPESAERVAKVWGFTLKGLGLGGSSGSGGGAPTKAPSGKAPAGAGKSADERAKELLQ